MVFILVIFYLQIMNKVIENYDISKEFIMALVYLCNLWLSPLMRLFYLRYSNLTVRLIHSGKIFQLNSVVSYSFSIIYFIYLFN